MTKEPVIGKSRNISSPRIAPGEEGRPVSIGGLSWRERFRKAADTGGHQNPLVILRSAAMEAQKSTLTQMAAALSYRTIFGLLPVIVVALIGIKMFAPSKIESALRSTLEYSGLGAIVVEESEDFVGPPQSVAPGTEAEAGIAPTVPKVSHTGGVQQWIEARLAKLNDISFEAIGVVSILTLIYSAVAMLVEIERAFNQIYRVPRGRSWVRRIMQYWTLLTLGPICLMATFWFGQQFQNWAFNLTAKSGISIGSGAFSVGVLGYLVTVVISTGFFLLAYTSVPNTKVKWYPALVGGLCAALMWEAAKWGFTQYIQHSTGSTKLYGSIALVPLFLLWVYVTWLIILFGLQVSYYLQHGRMKTSAQPLNDLGPMLVDPSAALAVVAAQARGFEDGRRLDVPDLAKATGLHDGVVRLVVARLTERGVLHRVDAGEAAAAEPAYALSRSPTSIRVAEILEIGFELAGGTGGATGSRSTQTGASAAEFSDQTLLQRLRAAQLTAAGAETLAELVGARESAKKPEPSEAGLSRGIAGRETAAPRSPNGTQDGAGNGSLPRPGSTTLGQAGTGAKP